MHSSRILHKVSHSMVHSPFCRLLLSGYVSDTLHLDAHARLVQAIQHVQLLQRLCPEVVDRLAVVVHLQAKNVSSSCTVHPVCWFHSLALMKADSGILLLDCKNASNVYMILLVGKAGHISVPLLRRLCATACTRGPHNRA